MKRFLFAIVIAIIVALLGWYVFMPWITKQFGGEPLKPNPNQNLANKDAYKVATVLDLPKPLAPFKLQDSSKQPYSNESLLGHWTLLFFGYAHCPGICPKTLAILSEVFKNAVPSRLPASTKFVFVSLNPKTDTPDVLKAFLSRFHPDFIGLTGEPEAIQALAKACRVYSWTAEEEKDTQGQKRIDHTASILLINPRGEMAALFTPPHEATALINDLVLLLN